MSNTDKTLSVVIPTIGRKLLEDTLESVVEKQTILPDEVIVFDNSGTGKVQAASRFSHHPLIVWKVSPERKSITDSWNQAVSFATKEYIHICGDDDLLYPDFVQKVKEKLKSNPGLLLCEADLMKADGTTLTYRGIRLTEDEYSVSRFWSLTFSPPRLEVYLSSIVFLKKFFYIVNGFKKIFTNGLFMDHLFALETAFHAGSIAVLHSPCWRYRSNVSDWSGATPSWDQQKLLPEQFNVYLHTVHQIFQQNQTSLPDGFDKETLRILLKQILSQHPSVTTSCRALFHVCLKRYISFRNNIDLLHDFCYLLRHH